MAVEDTGTEVVGQAPTAETRKERAAAELQAAKDNLREHLRHHLPTSEEVRAARALLEEAETSYIETLARDGEAGTAQRRRKEEEEGRKKKEEEVQQAGSNAAATTAAAEEAKVERTTPAPLPMPPLAATTVEGQDPTALAAMVAKNFQQNIAAATAIAAAAVADAEGSQASQASQGQATPQG